MVVLVWRLSGRHYVQVALGQAPDEEAAGGGTPYMRGRHLVAKNLQKKADADGGPTSPLSPLTSSKSFRLPSSPSSVVSAGGKSLSPSSTGEKEFEGARKAKRQDRASVD